MNIYNYNFVFKKTDKNNKNNLIIAITNDFDIDKKVIFYQYQDLKTKHIIKDYNLVELKNLSAFLSKTNLHELEKKVIKDELTNKLLILKQIKELKKSLNQYKESI